MRKPQAKPTGIKTIRLPKRATGLTVPSKPAVRTVASPLGIVYIPWIPQQ